MKEIQIHPAPQPGQPAPYNITFSDLRSFNFISGVCFYGKTAERVLSILATGNHRLLFPPGKVLYNV